MQNSKPIVSSILFVFIAVNYNAQTNINLESAVDLAIKNNLNLKNDKLRSEYQQKLIKSAVDIPQANVIGEFGQINSYYSDNKFGVTQSFNFPTVYTNQKNIRKEEWKSSVLNVALKEIEIKKLVKSLFYHYSYLKEKEKLLTKNDSIFTSYLLLAEQRFKTGESNILEKTTASAQKGQIAIQLNQVKLDIEVTLLQFQLALNSNTLYTPEQGTFKLKTEINPDTSSIKQHPMMKIIEQDKIMTITNRKLERSKLLPDLSLGYYNMTMKGTGADNILYNSSTRFQSIQFGIGIPIFFASQKARINAAAINQNISNNNYAKELMMMQTEYKNAIGRYQLNLSTINYFETKALKDAEIIYETSNRQFKSGEINYLEWVMLTNQAISIQSNYIDEVRTLNETIIQIEYLISK